MNTRATILLTCLFAVAAQGQSPGPFNDSNSTALPALTTDSNDSSLIIHPVLASDYNLDPTPPKEPYKIEHDVALTSFDEPSRMYILKNNTVNTYVGEFGGQRMFRFENDPSPWQRGPAVGAGLSLTPEISLFTEYQRGWWGADNFDWMENYGDTIHFGIRFEFSGSHKSD